MTLATPAAAPTLDAADPLATVRAFVAAVNAGDQPAAVALLAPDVTIVEDLPPYRWQGPQAGAEWMLAMWQAGQDSGLTDVRLELGEATRSDVDGDQAYLIVPGRLTLAGADRSLRADGQLTLALRRHAPAWQIAAFTWTGPVPASLPRRIRGNPPLTSFQRKLESPFLAAGVVPAVGKAKGFQLSLE